jgi:hypothetical protein
LDWRDGSVSARPGPSSAPRGRPFPDDIRSEEQVCLELIVRAATQLDVRNIRRPANGKRHHVVELEERALGAASA